MISFSTVVSTRLPRFSGRKRSRSVQRVTAALGCERPNLPTYTCWLVFSQTEEEMKANKCEHNLPELFEQYLSTKANGERKVVITEVCATMLRRRNCLGRCIIIMGTNAEPLFTVPYDTRGKE